MNTRTSDDFWKWTDVADLDNLEVKRKLVALRIHPQFISGDVSNWYTSRWSKVLVWFKRAWQVLTCKHTYEKVGGSKWCTTCDHVKWGKR